MSGTSADGIDVAIADISGEPQSITFEQLFFQTVNWPDPVRRTIFSLFAADAPASLLCRANFELAKYFSEAALGTISDAGLTPEKVDLIGSHGQTIWHDIDPANGQATSTLQIGDPSVIAAHTGITTVANFRNADIAVGGQGAPLVSIFDWLFLRPQPNLNGIANGWRAVQNIGGIGNATLLPPADSTYLPIAYDTGPGNALIDWAAAEISDGTQICDVDGQLAARGTVSGSLLETWMEHPYFEQKPPKSTGRELFSTSLARQWQTDALNNGLSDEDFIATLTELTAASIASSYVDFAPGPIAQVVLAGGGVHNSFLCRRIEEQINNLFGYSVELVTHEAFGMDNDAKEALTFALLAYLAVHGWHGNLPICTGAGKEVILGQIAPGVNWNELVARTG